MKPIAEPYKIVRRSEDPNKAFLYTSSILRLDKGGSSKEARHYGSMAIDGDDLLVVSRSGDENCRDAHNGNIITFHRVKNFRELVY